MGGREREKDGGMGVGEDEDNGGGKGEKAHTKRVWSRSRVWKYWYEMVITGNYY